MTSQPLGPEPPVTSHEAIAPAAIVSWSNECPVWQRDALRDLDAAVAAAYGWPADMANDEVLSRLLALNAERPGGLANGAGSQ